MTCTGFQWFFVVSSILFCDRDESVRLVIEAIGIFALVAGRIADIAFIRFGESPRDVDICSRRALNGVNCRYLFHTTL